jgi:hypothetical protein
MRAGTTTVLNATLNLGNVVSGVFTPVLAKYSKSFSLIDCISVGVDRMQRNFEPMRKQVEAWQRSELTDVTATVVIYEGDCMGCGHTSTHSPFLRFDLTCVYAGPKAATRVVHASFHAQTYIDKHAYKRWCRAIWWGMAGAWRSGAAELR